MVESSMCCSTFKEIWSINKHNKEQLKSMLNQFHRPHSCKMTQGKIQSRSQFSKETKVRCSWECPLSILTCIYNSPKLELMVESIMCCATFNGIWYINKHKKEQLKSLLKKFWSPHCCKMTQGKIQSISQFLKKTKGRCSWECPLSSLNCIYSSPKLEHKVH